MSVTSDMNKLEQGLKDITEAVQKKVSQTTAYNTPQTQLEEMASLFTLSANAFLDFIANEARSVKALDFIVTKHIEAITSISTEYKRGLGLN